MPWQLFLIPVSCALSGWLSIRLFLAVLFHPLQPKSILGIKFRGILPAQQRSIGLGIGKFVAENFLSLHAVEEKITDPSNLQKIMPAIEEHIDDFLRNKLKQQMPFIGMFVGDKTINSLKKVFITELETLFPKIMRNYVSNLAADLNIQELVSQRIQELSLEELETEFKKSYSKQLAFIEAFGCLVGLVIGLISALVIFYIK